MADAVPDVLEPRLAMYTRRTVSRMISVRTSTMPAAVPGGNESLLVDAGTLIDI